MVRALVPSLLCVLISQPSAAFVTHVRSTSCLLTRELQEGAARSQNFRALVDAIDASDLFVYVEESPQRYGVAAHLGCLGAGGGRRYVRITIDPRVRGLERLALLGHELQHAREIAEDRSIDGPDAIERLYQRIGFATAPEERAYESQAALTVARKILKELA